MQVKAPEGNVIKEFRQGVVPEGRLTIAQQFTAGETGETDGSKSRRDD
jgi:hypothetical protein